MAANTVMMHFKLQKDSLLSKETQDKVTEMGQLCVGELTGTPVQANMGEGDQLVLFQGKDKSHAVVRVYGHGLLTLDIEHYVSNINNPPQTAVAARTSNVFTEVRKSVQLSEAYIRALEHSLRDHFGEVCIESKCLFSPVRRGEPVWQYNTTSDFRLIETDYDGVVYETDSCWQNICIMHSNTNGNVLYLDSDVMIGESDLIYTETLCSIGQESYTNKEILILGGGDGGILNELLKQDPKFVTMAEIDEEVVRACRLYLRQVCQDSMDNLQGVNYKILFQDCVKVLEEAILVEKEYDYVINDLTEYTIDSPDRVLTLDMETSSVVTELALKVVKPDGKLFSRGNGSAEKHYHRHLEEDLSTLGCEFIRREAYVPSFGEIYSFYEIWKPQK